MLTRMLPISPFLVLIGHLAVASAALLSTPWLTLEVSDKDRTVPWVTYESREVIGVHFLTKPGSPADALAVDNYRIYSEQDAAYGTSAAPVLVSYRSRVIFATLQISANYPKHMRFGHHAFLRLPSPLREGASYTVTVSATAFGSETSFSLLVNESAQLNTNIRVSQVGYLLSGPKLAFVGAWLGSATAAPPIVHVALDLPYDDATRFVVQDAITSENVFEGPVRRVTPTVTSENPGGPNTTDLYTGQRVWALDFSALSTPGRYVVRLPGLGVSHAFRVATDAMRPVLGTLARGVYGQRCGTALSARYLAPWGATRPEACHMTDAEVMPVNPPPAWFTGRYSMPAQDNVTTLPPDPATGSYWLPQPPGGTRISPVGGHHDAGDYGKYVVNSGLFVGWLLTSLEVLGAEEDSLPLPEAGDGVPDLFQEVEWELQYMEGLQDTDGGVFCIIKPNTTAGEFYEGHLPCFNPGRDTCNFPAGDPRRGPRIAWPKDTTCTAQFAAAMARAARSPWFRTLRPAAAERYLARARAAWNFLELRAPFGALCYHHYGCTAVVTAGDAVKPAWEKTYNCYDPQGDQSHDERLWAAVELYGATGEAAYHTHFLTRHCPRYRHWGWEALPFSYGPATITYAELAVRARRGTPGAVPVNSTMAQRCLDELASVARAYVTGARDNPYSLIGPVRSFRIFGYGWYFPTEPAIHLLVAAALAATNASEAATWRDLAAQQIYYLLGANPQGFSHVTGLGARRIRNVVDQESVYDDLDPAWPGLPIGLTGGFSWINAFGSALGASFPAGMDYPALHRTADVYNIQFEFVVTNLAQTLGVVAALSGDALAGSGLPLPPDIRLSLSATSGPAPLEVRFILDVQGNPDAVDTVEYDFGDGGHSYQAQPAHVYGEPGRAFYGTVTVLDRAGQTSIKSFEVFTSWGTGSQPLLPPPASGELALAALLASSAPQSDWGGSLPPLLVATSLGGNAVGLDVGGASSAVTGAASGGISASSRNLAWQGPISAWSGAALRPERFEDRVTYTVMPPSSSSSPSFSLLAGAAGGLALEAWLYVEAFLTYSRASAPLLGLQLGAQSDRFFGLQGTLWTGNVIFAGGSTLANDTLLAPSLSLGRWHHLRLSASSDLEPTPPDMPAGGNGSCAVWLDGQLVARAPEGGCSAQKLFRYCGPALPLQLTVGSFKGYVDGLRIYASPTNGTLEKLCGPRPPPPPPPRPPPAPAPDNRFYPITPDISTIAVLDFDAACGLSGDALAGALPMRLYKNGAPTAATLLPVSAAAYTAGLSASVNGEPAAGAADTTTEVGNTAWMLHPTGCSLRAGSVAARNGSSGLSWHIPNATLLPARLASALSLDAKLYVEAWRTGYSYWNTEILSLYTNWDSYFMLAYDLWTHGSVRLWTPGANGTRATLLNASVLETAITPGCWHHIALTANASDCAFAVDGVELASVSAASGCDVSRLLPALGSAQNRSVLTVGGVRGWLDEVRVSSMWRPTQRPGDFSWSPPPPPPPPPPPSPSPPAPPSPPPPSPPVPPAPPAYDATTLLLLRPDASSCPAAGSGAVPAQLSLPSPALAAQMFSGGMKAGMLSPSVVGVPVFLSTLGGAGQPPAFAGHDGSCVVALNHSTCGSCANVSYTVPASLLAPIKSSGEMTLDAKLWVTKWVNYGIDNSDPLFGFQQSWDRYFKLISDKWQMGRALFKAPSTVTTEQGLFSNGTFVNRTVLESALSLGAWHHVALAMNATACVLYVDGALMLPPPPPFPSSKPVRCNVTALVSFAATATITVGGFQGFVADVRLSSSWRVAGRPAPVISP